MIWSSAQLAEAERRNGSKTPHDTTSLLLFCFQHFVGRQLSLSFSLSPARVGNEEVEEKMQ